MENDANPTEKYCPKHPNKKTKFWCENDQVNICSKCLVSDHRGHTISDKTETKQVQFF